MKIPSLLKRSLVFHCSDVNVYIPNVPDGIQAKELDVVISSNRVSISRRGLEENRAYYLNHELTRTVKSGECLWTFDSETREVHIQLAKSLEDEVWESVFIGHKSQRQEEEQDRKKLMLERFQAENPGFDFSGAEFTGTIPDPKTFLRPS